MLPNHYQLAQAIEADRHRGEARRHAHQRALREARADAPSFGDRLQSAAARLLGMDRPVDRACRLPDGRIGIATFVNRDGEWLMVCRVA